MKKLWVIVISVLFLTILLNADYLIKTKMHMDAFEMMGQKQPATDEIVENWIGKDRMLTHQQEKIFIVRMDLKKMYYIMSKTKSYIEINLPFDFSSLLPPEAVQMMSMMKMTLKVTPTKNTKMINKWNCQEYIVEMKMAMGSYTMNMWVTQDIKINLDAYAEMYTNVTAMGFVENADEFKKIKGYPIHVDMNMNMMGMNIKGFNTVIEITEKTPAKGLYSPPAGFHKKEKLGMQDFR
ncbi:MAG: DUF4412 domain-containing protein [Candidatus Aminicenantes bacterium]|nr:DUF4412 domain-containing protein [Candidatus Aminicenantes bacterium]